MDTVCNHDQAAMTNGKKPLQMHTSNLASISQEVGGVGYNIARAATLCGAPAKLCSVIADDTAGNMVRQSVADNGLDTSGLLVVTGSSSVKTSQYVSVNDNCRDLVLGMADMKIMEQNHGSFDEQWRPRMGETQPQSSATPKWMVVDANWPAETIHQWLSAGREAGLATAFEPVSVAKSARLLGSPALMPTRLPHVADLMTPNELELSALHDAARSSGLTERADWWHTIDALGIPSSGARSALVSLTSQRLVDAGVPQRAIQLLPFVPCILTKLGAEGVLMTRILKADDEELRSAESAKNIVSRSEIMDDKVGGLYMRLFPPAEHLASGEIVSVNGAGDTFLGALVARLAQGTAFEGAIDFAQRASVLTLKSEASVSPEVASLHPVRERR